MHVLPRNELCQSSVHKAAERQEHGSLFRPGFSVIHLKTVSVKKLGVIGGMGVVQAEGSDRVPRVKPFGKHAEVCEGCEQSSYICYGSSHGAPNITVQHQGNNASSAAHACTACQQLSTLKLGCLPLPLHV